MYVNRGFMQAIFRVSLFVGKLQRIYWPYCSLARHMFCFTR